MRPSRSSDRGRVIVIGGPTASGKSEAALALAKAIGGVIVNADSMQVYQELRIVTARPDDAMMVAAPHRLFSVLSVRERCSVGRWRAMAVAELDRAHASGAVPIVVGGTGLYLKALVDGLSQIPEIPEDVARHAADLLARCGPERFHGLLASVDPAAAAAIRPTDRQRLIRAWSVVSHTGRSLAEWHGDAVRAAPIGHDFHTVLLMPDRRQVYQACDQRFLRMLEQGAVAEVARLLDMRLDPSLPAMKAVGVPEIAAYLAGQTSWDEMVVAGRQATRRYAKRQYTWLRHQIAAEQIGGAQFSESLLDEIFPKIRQFLLTQD